jgi:ERCC4-type nuclease
MARPKDAKVWNEDLVRALKARQEQCRQQGKQQQFTWRDGAIAIEAVRGDIYMFKTGRIAGLPTGLKKTVDELCRALITDRAEILPPGYVPTSFDDQQDHKGGAYENDPYLKKIKIRGGAFAILMAFHISKSQVMTKDQICASAQSFCDEAMEANFNAGRLRGAWNGVETLVKHGLVSVTKTTAFNASAGGFRSNGKWTYTLTRNGEQFIEALLRRHPEEISRQIRAARPADNSAASVGRNQETPANPFFKEVFASGKTETKRAPPREKAAQSYHASKDEEELRVWSTTARIGEQRIFKVGKQRRQQLHDLCDQLNQGLVPSGTQLQHESVDLTTHSRALYVTMVRRGNVHPFNATAAMDVGSPASTTSFPKVAALNLDSHTKSSPPRRLQGAFSGTVNSIHLDEGTPTKRSRTIPPAIAAANAALARQAMHESLVEKVNEWSSSSLIHGASSEAYILDSDGSDGGGKIPAVERRHIQDVDPGRNGRTHIIDLLESDDDDSSIFCEKAVKPTGVAQCKVNDDVVVDLTQEMPEEIPTTFATSAPFPKLTIYIDSRERNRNATPRLLRTDLTRMIHSGPLKMVWPNSMVLAHVEEKELGCGDFAFQLDRGPYGSRIPVIVERKRIGDLVQRSAKKDHWSQLQKMRDMSDVSIFLLEGDFRSATQFNAFGSQEDEALASTNHTIDSEESIVLFMGRAILSSDTVGFIQTKDEQGSLRAVGALGLMSATASKQSQRSPESALNVKVERKRLADRLENGGIPFQLAHRVAEEIGSTKQMDLLYAIAENDDCREIMLAPVIADCCSALASKSSASRWSAACHRIYFSPLVEAAKARKIYSEYEHLVEDRANLLFNLQTGWTPEEALDIALSDGDVQVESPRSVSIELSKDGSDFRNCFAVDSRVETFYRFKQGQLSRLLPFMAMRTESGLFRSSRLFVFLLEGEQLVERVKQSLTDKNACFVASARIVADKIRDDCCDESESGKERRILVIRGLQAALDNAAKKPGYNSVLRAMVDMVLADIMIARESERMCVLQAVRLSNDLNIIVQQLALACFHFQLLTETTNRS